MAKKIVPVRITLYGDWADPYQELKKVALETYGKNLSQVAVKKLDVINIEIDKVNAFADGTVYSKDYVGTAVMWDN